MVRKLPEKGCGKSGNIEFLQYEPFNGKFREEIKKKMAQKLPATESFEIFNTNHST